MLPRKHGPPLKPRRDPATRLSQSAEAVGREGPPDEPPDSEGAGEIMLADEDFVQVRREIACYIHVLNKKKSLVILHELRLYESFEEKLVRFHESLFPLANDVILRGTACHLSSWWESIPFLARLFEEQRAIAIPPA